MRRLNASKAPSSESGEYKMDHIKLQSRSPARSANLFHRNPRPQPKFKLCIISSLSIALTFVLCYLFLFSRSSSSSASRRYAIIIDGGSTGTRIHVFRYDLVEKNPSFDFGEEGLASMKVNPGLSAYAEDPVGAGGSIRELIDFGKQRVPREYWSDTEIRLMATAGMRLLELRVQFQILETCRRVLRESGFKFRDEWASVITGSDEGMYAWVVANYALHTLGSDPQLTTGIIELGGASAQVTFSSSEPLPSEFSRIVKFRNTTYSLYSHSFLHFGQNVAFQALRESLVSGDNDTASKYLQQGVLTDPCTPKGYSYLEHRRPSSASFVDDSRYVSSIRTQGNFSECRSAALKMLQRGKDQCTHHHCYIGSTFTPQLQGKFMATENFFYTSMFFGLAERAPISDFISAGEQFCKEDWSVLKKRHSSMHEEDLLHYCFSSAYIVAILHDSLGIPLSDERIVFANQVGSIPLDWALGAFILQSTTTTMEENEVNKSSDWIGTIIGEESPILLLVAFILIACIFIAWYILRSGKTQFKTIYDLEKGRYIVTRVNR